MIFLIKLISIYLLAVIVLIVSGSAYLSILSLFTLLIHWILISNLLREPPLEGSRNILIFYSLLLCLISVFSYKQSVIIGGELTPYLGGSDGEGYFDQALKLAGNGKLDQIGLLASAYFGYQLILSYAFDIFGTNLFVGLLLNNTLVLLTVILTTKITWMLTRHNQTCFYSTLAFILTTKFIFYSNSLLKDPFLIFGVALVSYMVTMIHIRKAMMPSSYFALFLAALIFGVMRQPMLVLIPLSFLLLGRRILKTIWIPIIIFSIAGTTFFAFIGTFTTQIFSVEQIINIAFNNQLLSKAADDGTSIAGVVGTVSTAYGQLPVFIRMLLVPIPAILQFILPFNFWSTNFLNDHLISFFNINANIIWYLFIGVFMIYGVLYWRRLPKNMSTRLFLLGAVAYLAHALVFGGVVPRYGSPYLVMMFPTIGYLMSCTFKKRGNYIHINQFFQFYYFAVLIAVILFLFLSIARYA